MFDLGSWGELIIIAFAALVLLGPKEIPHLLRFLGRWLSRFRRMSQSCRHQIDLYLNQGELEEYQDHARTKAEKEAPSSQTNDVSPSHNNSTEKGRDA